MDLGLWTPVLPACLPPLPFWKTLMARHMFHHPLPLSQPFNSAMPGVVLVSQRFWMGLLHAVPGLGGGGGEVGEWREDAT